MCGDFNIDVVCGLPSPSSGPHQACLLTDYSVRIVVILVRPANLPVSLAVESTTIYFLSGGGGGGRSAASRGLSRPAYPIHPVHQNNRKPPTTEHKPSLNRAASPKRSISCRGRERSSRSSQRVSGEPTCMPVSFWSTPSRRRHHESVTLLRWSELLLSFFLFLILYGRQGGFPSSPVLVR